MGNPLAKSLIDAAMKQGGGSPAAVIDSFVERKAPEVVVSGQILLCLSSDCSFKEDYVGQDIDICPLCGFRVVRFYNERTNGADSEPTAEYLIPEEDQKVSGHRLSHLRPGDKFVFVGPLPFKTVTHAIEYAVSPAPRGFIRFSDPSNRVYKIRLEHGFVFPVVLCSGTVSSDTRRFHRGDRVIHKVANYVATVFRVDGDLCKVQVNGETSLRPVPSSLLDLTQKDETTRSYVSKNEAGKFVVKFADHSSSHDSLLDALKTLQREHRTAFYRFSKMLSTDPGAYELGKREIEYLMEKDSKVWAPKAEN